MARPGVVTLALVMNQSPRSLSLASFVLVAACSSPPGAGVTTPPAARAEGRAPVPEVAAHEVRRVSFSSDGVRLAGNLYVPRGVSASRRAPALVTLGPMSAVKELVVANYAPSALGGGFQRQRKEHRTPCPGRRQRAEPTCAGARPSPAWTNQWCGFDRLRNLENRLRAAELCARAARSSPEPTSPRSFKRERASIQLQRE